jgi:hypothetical protein
MVDGDSFLVKFIFYRTKQLLGRRDWVLEITPRK